MSKDAEPQPLRRAEQINFGGWLLAELERRGWSRNRFAQELGLNYKSIVYKWANNEQRPTTEHCAAIARCLKLDVDTVLAAAGQRPRDELAAGVIRGQAAALLNHVDEVLLIQVIPYLEALANPRTSDRVIARLAERLPGAFRADNGP